ncbi:MAG: molybdopterin-dependent oxidoreductase [Acidimicrobiales bacterium]|nr:molybdopterin-dependent oxidoreductase [Acidimicrobiales bacterium]
METTNQYRKRWSWDRVTWGTHCLNCLATCSYRVYSRDGKVAFEEQGGTIAEIEAGVPDFNPLGCQKGSAWSLQLDGEDRITKPLRRVGERGSGKWEEITWDEALADIADSIIDAIDEDGPESVVFEESVEGGLMAQSPFLRLASLIGAVTLDAQGLVNDLPIGQHITFGKFSCASTVDDSFHSEVLLLWHANPAYTSIPYFHYITEARYKGAKVISIAPDYNASCVNADMYVPVKPGSDAALALSICQVLLEDGKVDLDFVKAQTDLPLLVRSDNLRFLRERDLVKGGSEEHFYFWDQTKEVVEVPRSTLDLGEIDPALHGPFKVALADGSEVEVFTVLDLIEKRLLDYTPELASAICGVSPETIRELALIIAGNKTKIIEGFNAPKYFHGDLMERSMCLLLALTGNWGKPGTGIQGLALAGLDGYLLFSMKTKQGVEETARLLDGIDASMEQLRQRDPEATDEMLGNQLLTLSTSAGTSAPPVFFNYNHVGYKESWNNSAWQEPTMTKSFSSYMEDALRRGWWGGVARPSAGMAPRVFFAVGTNPMRRARGGKRAILETLWPKLEKIVAVDIRMSSTALYADIVLPAAMQYERVNVQYPITHTLHLAFSDKAVEPKGEAKTEWEIFSALANKISERSVERDIVEFTDGRRLSRRLDTVGDSYTIGGAFQSDESVIDEWIRDSSDAGTLPPGTSVETLRTKGTIRFTGLGVFAPGLSVATDVKDDKVLTAFQWHVDKKLPFPTLTKRAQFYIDHPWFMDADEALPRHKDNPKMGGDYPFVLTSGHSRWTVHAVSMGNSAVLSTHRGQPLVVMGAKDALDLNIGEGTRVKVYNDHGSFIAMVKVAPRVRPNQLIIYNGFEPHMFEGWNGSNEVEPGMVKWLHLVGKYGHLRYLPFGWQPVPSDRAVSVGIMSVPDSQRIEESS